MYNQIRGKLYDAGMHVAIVSLRQLHLPLRALQPWWPPQSLAVQWRLTHASHSTSRIQICILPFILLFHYFCVSMCTSM